MNPNKNSPTNYNFSPLHENISWSKSMVNLPRRLAGGSSSTKILSIIVIAILIFVSTSLSIVLLTQNNSDDTIVKLVVGIITPFVAVFAVIAIEVQSDINSQRNNRREQFAKINNFMQINLLNEPNYNGLIFNQGTTKWIDSAYVLNDSQNTEIGNYSYETGSGKNSTVHLYGYIKMDLPRRLPHLLLDAKHNNGVANTTTLPLNFAGGQKLELEGDFNNFFTVFVPQGYEQDALYILTPNIMHILVSNFSEYDIEIVDNNLYIYSTKFFKLDSEQELKPLFAAINALYRVIYSQSDMYQDENVPEFNQNIVSEKGSRLKNNSKLIIVIFCIIALLILATFLWFILPEKSMVPVIVFGIASLVYAFTRMLY